MTAAPQALYYGPLPPELDGYREDVELALDRPVPASWPEDATYVEAPQVELLFHTVQRALHPDLVNLRWGVCYRQDMAKNDRQVWAKVGKAGGKLGYFAELDVVLEVNWTVWKSLGPRQKLALLDHELCHVTRDDDGNAVLLCHDLEEFTAIVRRWGAWKADVRQFLLAVQQLELFADEATDPAERVVRHIGEHVEAFAEAAATGLDPDTTVTVTITAAGRSGSARGRGKKGTRRE